MSEDKPAAAAGSAVAVAITLKVNGQTRQCRVAPGASLLETIRGELGLTGTKQGCGSGDCGACTVLLDGRPVNSCLVLAVEADGHEIVTIEGLAGPGDTAGDTGGSATQALGAAVQASFLAHGAVQCGFCSPGMILTAVALLQENPDPTEAEVREAMAGNLCRCTGYSKIVEAVVDAGRSVSELGAADPGATSAGPETAPLREISRGGVDR